MHRLHNARRAGSRTSAAVALLAALSTSGALSAQITQANYPLIVDLLDSTAAYGPIALTANGSATPPAPPNGSGNGVCHDGTYFYSVGGGQNIQSPVISTLDQNDFQIEVDFNLTALPSPYNRPILMGGNGWRWIGLYANTSGTLGVLYNNASYTWSTTTVTPGTWYSAAIKYEGGFVELYLNGTLIHSANLGPLNTNNNFNFTTNNFSNGTALNGCIRHLVISNDTTLSGTYGLNTTVGIGCGAGNPTGNGTAYELFTTAAPFDLSNTSQSYFWTGNEYLLVGVGGAVVPPVGAAMTIGDDQTQAITLPFAFPCAQGLLNQIYLCSNGWISFEPTTSVSGTESVTTLLNGPNLLAFMYDDLDPSVGGTVHAQPVGTNEFDITFTNVPEYGIGGANTVQVALFDSGTIEVRYGTCSIMDGMVGMSSGHGATNPGPTDYSNLAVIGPVTITTGVGPFWTTLGLSATTRPVLGTSWDLRVNVIPTGTVFGINWFGTSNPNVPNLAFLGMPGCGAYASLDLVLGPWVPTVGSTYNYSLLLPATPLSLIGFELFTQSALAILPPSNSFGLETTNGIMGKLGDQ
ncbi:MAG TPA: LamG-like jellyroll fold domain-containing protein [Planctomycetota bacterium]|nr:LamG-like jellyroll fold domain-containing protein [Planctomycetota bacterium]